MTKSQLDTIAYHVRPGDNLTRIINRYYGLVSPQKRQTIITQIQQDNPKVKNPDYITPNQLLMLDIPTQCYASPLEQKQTPVLNISKAELQPLQQQFNNTTPQGRNTLSSLAPIILGSSAATLTAAKTTFQSNTSHLAEIVQYYNDYKAEKITKGQYDYRRRKAISQLNEKLGPLKRIVNKNKTSREILRISTKRGRRPTGNITRQIAHMNKLSSMARTGGIVLATAGLGVACYDIAQSESKIRKNQILVESLGGLAGGAIFGAGITILLIGTPVGWVAALVIGVGSVAASYAAGAGAKLFYDTSYRQVDLATITGVSHLCR